jgi:hypothetical protein
MNLFKPQIAPTYRLKPQKMPFFKKNTEGVKSKERDRNKFEILGRLNAEMFVFLNRLGKHYQLFGIFRRRLTHIFFKMPIERSF